MTDTIGMLIDVLKWPSRTTLVRTVSLPAALREALLWTALCLVVLGATVAGYSHSMPLAVAADNELRFVFQGFSDVERNEEAAFRWTMGNSSVCVEQYGYPPLSRLSLILLGQGAVSSRVDQAALLVNSHQLAVVPLSLEPRHYHLLFGQQHQRDDDLCITISSATARVASDSRELGVPFRALELQRIRPAGLVMPATLQLVLNLALALLCFFLLRYLGIAPWLAALCIILATLLLSIGIASGRVTTGIGVTRNLLPLVGSGVMLLAGSLGVRVARHHLQQHGKWPSHLLVRDLVAMAFWSVVLWSAVRMIQQAQGRHGVWPLKAGVWPNFTLLVIIPALFFVVWLALVIRRLHSGHSSLMQALILVLAGALVLPAALKVSVRGWDSLFYTFRDNPADYIHDVPHVGNPITFLSNYVDISPTLTWHSANHPPGSVLLLWGIDRLFGAGAVPSTWAVMALGCLNAVAAFWLGLRLGGPKLAVLASAILVAMPGHQVYNVTSMDAIFSATIALGAVALFLSLEPGASPYLAVLAGALIALALMFTYAATQLCFFGAAICILALVRKRGLLPVLRQAGLTAGTLVAIYLLLYLLTGFNIVEGALRATANNSRLVSRDPVANEAQFLAPPTLTYYVHYLGVNIIPYAWYLAPWGLAALTSIILASRRSLNQPSSLNILALGLVAWVAGMWLSGLFIREVERIWAFTYPLAAVLIAHHAWQGATRQELLWRAGLYVTLFFAQSATMRMLLNTYW